MQTLNIVPLLAEALGYNIEIRKDIDLLYQRNKYVFYKYAVESEWYTCGLITDSDFLKEEYSKKSLGIILYLLNNHEDNKCNEEFDKIIKKGFPYTHAFIMNNSKISFRKFCIRLIQKSGGLENISDTKINSNLSILLFLALNLNKEININDEAYVSYLDSMNALLSRDDKNHYTRINMESISSEEKEDMEKLRNEFLVKYGSIKNNPLHCSNVFKNVAAEQIVEFIFDYEYLSTSLFDNINLNNEDMDKIFHLISLFETDSSMTETHFIYLIYFVHTLKAYKLMKDHYFKNNKETMFIEYEFLEKRVKQLSSEIDLKEKDIINANNKIKQLERELKQYKDKEKESKIYEEELFALRNLMFSLDNQEDFENDNKIDYDKLENAKFLIIGGHEKWQQRMKELLKNSIFIHTDNLAFDINLVNSCERVYVYTNYINHGIYYKVIGACKKFNKKIEYLTCKNEELLLKKFE